MRENWSPLLVGRRAASVTCLDFNLRDKYTFSSMTCPVCKQNIRRHLTPWIYKCDPCGFLNSTLQFNSNSESTIDEGYREVALNGLREKNFKTIADRLKTLRGNIPTTSLLDVGCAHGWFLKTVKDYQWKAAGIEPDLRMSGQALKNCKDVRTGFFPAVLNSDEKFDIIIFNDVFEHLPDIHQAMDSCKKHLNPGGLLAINLPDSKGIFYRLATGFAKLGLMRPLERMWQKDFPSPHVSYFSSENLKQLAAKYGFSAVHSQKLPSLTVRGHWSRLRYDKNSSFVFMAFVWTATLMAAPFLAILPADISLEIFRRES
jgi:SAM-dependent methyltransferase